MPTRGRSPGRDVRHQGSRLRLAGRPVRAAGAETIVVERVAARPGVLPGGRHRPGRGEPGRAPASRPSRPETVGEPARPWVKAQPGCSRAGGRGRSTESSWRRGGSSFAAARSATCRGLPKIIVSTMAAGDVAPYVGASDVTMTYSVVDVAGINKISRAVLGNAVAGIVGMAKAHRGRRLGVRVRVGVGVRVGVRVGGDRYRER